MENTSEITQDLRTIVGGQHLITPSRWALSLVRKANADHAYLILEGVDENNERFCMDAHLVVKKTNERKADIVFRGIPVNQLKEIGDSCHAYTWTLSKEAGETLITTIKSEKARADRNEINYVLAGKTQVNTFISNSLWNESKESLENHSQNASIEGLTRDGHSCCSWAISMVKSLGLPTPSSFTPFIVCVPRHVLKNTHNGNLEEPSSRCSIM